MRIYDDSHVDMIGICHVNYWTIDADIIGMIVILSLQKNITIDAWIVEEPLNNDDILKQSPQCRKLVQPTRSS